MVKVLRASVILGITILLLCCPAAASAMRQAFLVQNSGWMEPFYTDPSSPLKALVARTVDVVAAPGDEIALFAFNQSSPGNESPRLLARGGAPLDTRQALAPLSPARRSGNALADTDFNEAVVKTITSAFNGEPGIIWIFTNNRNSPNNNAETAARNREFYSLLHEQPAIARTLAFPLAMPVVGKAYKANGLMVYALAYGQPASDHLNRMLAEGRIASVYTQAPAHLKPLDRDAVRIVPRKVLDAQGVSAALGADRRTLVLDLDADVRLSAVQIVADMQNLFYPYGIDKATISAHVALPDGDVSVPVTPPVIENLAPGQAAEARIVIPVNINRPSMWSWEGITQFGRSISVPAVLTVQLDNQQLAVSEAFRGRLQEIFPGDPLPDVFVPPSSVRGSIGRIPLLVRVNYPLYPLLLMGGTLLAVGGLALAVTRGGGATTYHVMVNGTPRRVSLRRFSHVDIYGPDNERVAVLTRGWGQPQLKSVKEGTFVSLSA